MLSSIALLPHTKPRRVVFSPDGSRFVVADESRLVIYSRDGDPIVEAALSNTDSKPFVCSIAWSDDDRHVAVGQRGVTRLHATTNLSTVAESTDVRMGALAFCAGGSLLAIGASTRHVHVLEVPSLDELGSVKLVTGDYDMFDIDHVVADPAGTLIAASDYGGYSDDDWGHAVERGTPKLTIIDAADPARAAREFTQPQPITGLAFDRWRRRLLVGNYKRIVMRELDSWQLAAEWSPYGKHTVKVLAVCERFIATLPDLTWGPEPTLDLWHPTTFERLASAPLLEGASRGAQLVNRPWFVAPSPDGSRIVVPELDGVRVWAFTNS